MSVNASYTIQMASKISGVGVHTIRAWEKRYKALEPYRDSAGHRVYTKTDIEKLMLLSELCLLGYTISKVAKFPIAELKMLLIDLGKSEESIDSPEFSLVKEKAPVDSTQSLGILFFALRSYKVDVIHQELGKIKNSLSAREMVIDVLLPFLEQRKKLLSEGEMSVERGEVVATLLRFHAGHLLYKVNERKERSSINVLVAGMEGESSVLESMMAGLLCNYYGFNYSFLGSLSLGALIDSLSFLNTHLLVLNATSSLLNFGKAFVQNYVEKIYTKSSQLQEIALCANVDFEGDRFSAKRLHVAKSIVALDDFLAKKTSLL